MKYLVTFTLLFCISIGYAQKKSITIDYSVQYTIPSKYKKVADTVTIGFDKNGKYLWTDSEYLARDFGKSIFKGKESLLQNAEMSIVFDTENGAIMLFFTSGKNEMYMNIELSSIIPLPENSEDNNFELISESSNETITVAGREAVVYDVFPSNKESDKISLAFDESINLNNNKLFKKFFELIFAAEGSSTMEDINLPNGLLLRISSNNETMIEATQVDTKIKTLKFNYSFKITE